MNWQKTDYAGDPIFIFQVSKREYKFYPQNMDVIDDYVKSIQELRSQVENYYKYRSGAV